MPAFSHEPSDPDFDTLSGRIVEIAQFYAQIGGFLLLETGQESADTLLAFLGELAKRGAQRDGQLRSRQLDPLRYGRTDRSVANSSPTFNRCTSRRPAARRQGPVGRRGGRRNGRDRLGRFRANPGRGRLRGRLHLRTRSGRRPVGDIAKGIAALLAAMEEVASRFIRFNPGGCHDDTAPGIDRPDACNRGSSSDCRGESRPRTPRRPDRHARRFMPHRGSPGVPRGTNPGRRLQAGGVAPHRPGHASGRHRRQDGVPRVHRRPWPFPRPR